MAAHLPIRTVFLAGSVLLLAGAAELAPQTAASAGTHVHKHEYRHEIDQMEEAWRTAMLKGNGTALDSLLAEDYTAITAQGAIQTKEQAISSLRSGRLQLTGLSISDRKVRIYGSTAVVTSVAELTGNRDSKEVSGKYRYTRVYVRNSQGQWKIVSFEASRIQESGDHK